MNRFLHRRGLRKLFVLVPFVATLFVCAAYFYYDKKIPLSVPVNCLATLNQSRELNLKVVRSYPSRFAEPYLRELGLSLPISTNYDPPPERPVIATAASSNHFIESKYFIRYLKHSFSTKFGRFRIIFYDIGLWDYQFEQLNEVCTDGCEMRKFPFEKFPNHVRNAGGFAWKPLIIQNRTGVWVQMARLSDSDDIKDPQIEDPRWCKNGEIDQNINYMLVLEEFGFVMWMDSSVRVFNTNFSSVFNKVATDGIWISHNGGSYVLAAGTHPSTFEKLAEHACAFRNATEYYATFIIVYRNEFALNYVMRPWVACALTPNCMVLNVSPGYCTENRFYGECHRFDQSVISIILHRLFHPNPGIPSGGIHWDKCGFSYYWILPDFVNDYRIRNHRSLVCKTVEGLV